MNDGRKNLIGDFVMTSVTGCTIIIGVLAISMAIFTSLGILIALFK